MSLMDPAAPASGAVATPDAPRATVPDRATPGAGTPAQQAPDRAPRHERAGRAAPEEPRRGLRLPIGAKMGVLIAALFAVLVSSSAVLIAQNRATTREFDAILGNEVRQALLARQMQVEFKKQVQEWKNILLRGSDREDLLTYSASFEEQDAKVHALYREMLASNPNLELKAQVQRLVELDRTSDVAYDKALKAFSAGGGEDAIAADRAVRGIDRPATELVDKIVADLETRMSGEIAAQRQLTAERQRLTLVLSASLLALLASLLVLALIRIVRPIRQLTRQADRVAGEQLPAAITQVKGMQAGDDPPVLPPFVVHTRDELSELAASLSSLQQSALDQAIEQHRADRETADMLVNLGRRNQNLLGRMLSYVTELERKEQDPDVLAQLFRLDHATTRIRRNAESMLVLAGATQTRTWSRPVPVIDVVRAALSEIEEYVRVDLHHIEDGLVNGSAVADVVHLIAELVENATHFSPPTTQVTVVGQRVREGYRLRVIDQGVGMTRRELDDANQRIQRSDGGWADSKLLGLYVVGRLARRRSIEVALEPSAGRGITASILLPESVLATPGGAPALSSSTSAGLPPAGASSAGMPAGPAPSGVGPALEPAPLAAAPAPVDPWAPPADHPALGRPAPEITTFSASTSASSSLPSPAPGGWSGPRPAAPGEPRPTIPAAFAPVVPVPSASPPAGPGDRGPGRVIDLTGPGERVPPGAGDPHATTGVPVHWFAPEPGESGRTGPASLEGPVATGGPAPITGRASGTAVTDPVNGSRGPAVAAMSGPPTVIPRRVRGAQLPDLGPAAEPVIARPEEGPGAAESLRWQLRSFQLDVQAARRAINETEPGSRPGAATPDHLDEQAERNHGHHPEGE